MIVLLGVCATAGQFWNPGFEHGAHSIFTGPAGCFAMNLSMFALTSLSASMTMAFGIVNKLAETTMDGAGLGNNVAARCIVR